MKKETHSNITTQRTLFVGSRPTDAAADASSPSSSQQRSSGPGDEAGPSGSADPPTARARAARRSPPGPEALLYLEESQGLVSAKEEEEGDGGGGGGGGADDDDDDDQHQVESVSSGPSSAASTPPDTPIISLPQPRAAYLTPPGGLGSQQLQPAAPAVIRSHRPRGSLWQHFSSNEEDPRLATCNICQAVVRRGSDPRHLSSTALRTHLQRHHCRLLPLLASTRKKAAGEAREMEAPPPAKRAARAAAAAAAAEGARPPQPAVLQEASLPLIGAPSLSQRARARAQEATTRVVGEMVALSGVPLSFVESLGFRHLLRHLAPWYEPPSRRTLSRRVMPSLYESVREMVRAQLDRARGRKIHFTSDLWTGGHHTYLALTAHWWQPEDVRDGAGTLEAAAMQGEPPAQPAGYRVVLLQARNMEDSATGRSISEELLSALREWAPEGEVRRGYMVTDAGRSMLAGLNAAGLEGVVCMAHKLHLVARDALGLGSEVRETWCEGTHETRALLDKCRELVGHFSRGANARQLREKQEELALVEHALLQDVPTRWTSTFEMVMRLVEQKAVLEDLMAAAPLLPGGRELGLSATDWLALSQMVDVLKPFDETAKVLCGPDASLGHVIPLIHALDQGLTSCLAEGSSLLPRNRALVLRLQAGIWDQLHPLCWDRVYQLSCLCDPRVKGSLASSLEELQRWKAELSLEVRKVVEAQGGDVRTGMQGRRGSGEGEGCPQESSPLPGCANQRPAKVPYLASVIAWAVSSSVEEEQDSAEAMVSDYVAEPLLPPTADPLCYWASKAEVWPQLASVAMDLLSVPPTSVQSERVFSQLGDILRPRRSRLDPSAVERLAFIRFNLSALGFPSPKL